MTRRNWTTTTAAAFVAATGFCAAAMAQAYDTACKCTVYLDIDKGRTLVIDNAAGSIEEKLLTSDDNVLGMPPRGENSNDGGLRDCSTEEIQCVELVKQKIILAFKPGTEGDKYTVGGVRFEITGTATLPQNPGNKIYAVGFKGKEQLGGFVYTSAAGIVSLIDECIDESAIFETMKCGRDVENHTNAKSFLIDGPGLLSPTGFPAGYVMRPR